MQVVVFKWQPKTNEKETIPSQSIVSYTSEHVNTFARMLKRNLYMDYEFLCVTDNPQGLQPGLVKAIPLWDKCRNLGGCYNRLYVFSDDMKYYLGSRILCMDLDMVITQNITPIIRKFNDIDFVYYRMRGPDGTGYRMNNSMFMMNAGARRYVWEKFEAAYNHYGLDYIKKYVTENGANPGTDQAWCNRVIDIDKEWYWSMNDGIYDMRLDFIETGKTKLPDDSRIVMFPGPRDPTLPELKQKYQWIEEYYK